MNSRILLILFLAIGLPVLHAESPSEWTPVLTDNFEREAIGMDWDITRGEWRIGQGRLVHAARWNTVWTLRNARPLPGNIRIELEAEVPANGWLSIATKIGDQFWDGGGRYTKGRGPRAEKGAAEGMVTLCSASADEAVKKFSDFTGLTPGKPNRIIVDYVDGKLTASVDGKVVKEQTVSLDFRFNNHVAFLTQDVAIDNVVISTKPFGETYAATLPTATPASNRAATVDATKFLDSAKPGAGIQTAIDSLPPTGGVVILPKGEFVLRQPIFLRDGVALRGQGRDTTLTLPSPIVWSKLTQDAKKSDTSLVVENAGGFTAGMVINIGPDHQMMYLDETSPWRVTKVDGNTIHLDKPLDGDALKPLPAGTVVGNFFPMIYASHGSDMEVRDLTINGRATADPAPFKGGYGASAVTFFRVRELRVDNVFVDGWKGDAFSFQSGRDINCTRNTVTNGLEKGYHPGSCQRRTNISRCVAENSGDDSFFFCRYNKLSTFNFNTFNRSAQCMMGGLAASGDSFSTVYQNYGEGNAQGIPITTGGDHALYGNVLVDNGGKSLIPITGGTFSDNRNTWYPVNGIPRYFVIVGNTFIDHRATGETPLIVSSTDTAPANVVAGNRYAFSGTPPEAKLFAVSGPGNIVTDNIALKANANAKPAVELTPLPDLPQPIIAAADFYKPGTPDCGFQAALDEAAKKGGTVLLPAGWYPLEQSLSIPSGVTLCGEGMATILLPKRGVSAITSAGTKGVAVRQLSVRGPDFTAATDATQKGIALENVDGFLIADVRVEGMGVGFDITGGKSGNVVFSKTRGCNDGLAVRKTQGLDISESHFLESARNGISAEDLTGELRVLGNIIWLNRENGVALNRPPSGSQVSGNVIADSGENGIRLAHAEKTSICGNVILNASRNGPSVGAGVLMQDSTGTLIEGNRICDETYDPMGLTAARETGSSNGSMIRFNACAPHWWPQNGRTLEKLVETVGKQSVAENNVLAPYPADRR